MVAWTSQGMPDIYSQEEHLIVTVDAMVLTFMYDVFYVLSTILAAS